MKRKINSIFSSIVLCLILTSASVLPVLAVPQTVSAETNWADDITVMLDAGNYAEGEVIAGVLASGRSVFGNRFLRKDDLIRKSEEITDCEGSDLDTTLSTSASNEKIDIVYIQREDMTTEEILRHLAENPDVVFAEPNYLTSTEAVSDENLKNAFVKTFSEARSHTRSSSARLSEIADLTPQQWSSWDGSDYVIEGQSGNSIHVPNFETQTGNMEGDPVVIAVMDNAIDFNHPDLEPVAYTFTEEQQRILGCDVHGFNAASESTDGILEYYPTKIHGTHCAGIIGAAWDRQGMSGVASNVKMVSIQHGIDNEYTSLVNILRGLDFIDRANELGCGISLVSNSWGLLQGSRALDAAIRNLGDKWDVLCIFASGNYGRDNASYGYEAATLYDNPYVIMVSAMDSAGKISPYSNYGHDCVDVAAPGSGIISAVNTDSYYLQYFSDAVPDTNKYYNGFEDNEINIGLKWINWNDPEKPPAGGYQIDAELTDSSHFAGSKGLRLPFSEEAKEMTYDGMNYYTLLIDLGDVSELGVNEGDFLGFTLGCTDYLLTANYDYLDKNTGEFEPVMDTDYMYTYSNGWTNTFMAIPENADLTNLQIMLLIVVTEGIDSIYIDSIGIGTELVPYVIQDGTSMACPCVCGFAAVLKSQYPNASAKELADIVKSKVRPEESFDGLTRTGGVIDFLVDGTPGSAETAYGPSISDIEVSADTVKISGSNFTDSGTASVFKYVAGKEEAKNATVISWTDSEVILSLAESIQGILDVKIENQDGKYDTAVKFVSKSENIYEEDLPFDKSTGDPYIFDADGDYETNGPLIGLNNKLYYLPALTKTEVTPAYKRMRCFDIQTKTWSELTELPTWLSKLSAVMYDGRIVVKGSTMKLAPDGSPQYDDDSEEKIYVYDPKTADWSEGSVKNVNPSDSIANNDGTLILVGGGDIYTDPETEEMIQENSTVRAYDLSSGSGEVIAELNGLLFNPRVGCQGGVIYVFDQNYYTLERIINGASEDISDALPYYFDTLIDDSQRFSIANEYEWDVVLLPVSDGIMIVGPAAADGSSDTFILRGDSDKFESYEKRMSDDKEGTDIFEPYEKRMSDDKVRFLAAASYRGYVYAIGTAPFEPGQEFFRRTKMDVSEYAGDIKESGADDPDPDDDDPDSPDDDPDSPDDDPEYDDDDPEYADDDSDTPGTSGPTSRTSLKTGDHNDPAFWIVLLVLSTGGMAGTCIALKRRKPNS